MEDNAQLIKMLQTIRLMKKFTEEGEKKDKNTDNINPIVRSINAALPYLPTDQQRTFGIIAKLIEINELIENCRKIAASDKKANADFNRAILMAIREQANESQKNAIDTFIRVFEVNKMINDTEVHINE